MKYKWIAQDSNGRIQKYSKKPVKSYGFKFWFKKPHTFEVDICGPVGNGFVNNWEDTLIDLRKHDFKIENLILVKAEKETNRHPHADMIIEWAKTMRPVEYYDELSSREWLDIRFPSWYPENKYRFKP